LDPAEQEGLGRADGAGTPFELRQILKDLVIDSHSHTHIRRSDENVLRALGVTPHSAGPREPNDSWLSDRFSPEWEGERGDAGVHIAGPLTHITFEFEGDLNQLSHTDTRAIKSSALAALTHRLACSTRQRW
jgi:hypothetical protein